MIDGRSVWVNRNCVWMAGYKLRVGDRVVSDTTGYLCGACRACAEGNYIMCEKRRGLGFGMNGAFAKYVRIPGELLRRAYAADRLRTDEMIPRVLEMYGEETEYKKNRSDGND